MTVDVTLISRQPAALGPHGDTCAGWALTYTLTTDSAGTGHLIDSAAATTDAGYRSC